MIKGKEWLEGRVKGFQEGENMFTAEFNAGVQDALEYVQELIDQLDEPDEPEVLSQKWVDENVVEGDFRGGQQFWYGRFIEEEKVINLLVPKQNKPIIPQFVADYIEYYKGTGITLGTWFNFVNEGEFERKTEEWVYSGSYEENLKREYLLIDAIRYGYEVEKEKRYYIINKENNATLMTFELSDVVGEEIIEFVDAYSENETIHFDSKEKAKLIAHFVGDFVEVEEVKE